MHRDSTENGLLAAPILGWAGYFGLMWRWTGNPFEGFDAQKYWGAHAVGHLWDLPRFLVGFFQIRDWHTFTGSVLDRLAFLILLYCLPVIRRLGVDMLLWTLMLGILPAMSGTFTSFVRFASCAFPMFVALAVATERSRTSQVTLATGFGIVHCLLLWRFINYRWAG